MKNCLVLMYHALFEADSGFRLPAEVLPYSLKVSTFQQHLQVIRDSGCTVLSSGDLEGSEPVVSDNSILLTFDDSWESHYTLAGPLLREKRMDGVFFITAGEIGHSGCLSRDQLAGLAGSGMGIGSHGLTHTGFDRLDRDGAERELSQSRKLLQEYIGQEIDWLSLPGGTASPQLDQLARANGYRQVFTSKAGLWQGTFSVPRLVMRSSTSAAALAEILKNPAAACRRQNRRDLYLRILRNILGSRLYQRLRHAWCCRHAGGVS